MEYEYEYEVHKKATHPISVGPPPLAPMAMPVAVKTAHHCCPPVRPIVSPIAFILVLFILLVIILRAGMAVMPIATVKR